MTKHLKQLRTKIEKNGKTVTELSKKMGFTTNHIYSVLSGRSPISIQTAKKFQKVLGVNGKKLATDDVSYRYSR